METAGDNKTLESRVDHLKKNIIPRFKEIFGYLIEAYSRKQAMKTSDPMPDLSKYKLLHSKYLTNLQFIEKIIENFKSKTKETKFFITVKNQEIFTENEKLSKILEKISHLENINRYLIAERESFSIEIHEKNEKFQVLKQQVKQSLESQNTKLKANLSAACKGEQEKMAFHDLISANQNTLKRLKNQIFKKELELCEKKKILVLAKEQNIFLYEERKALEEKYEKIKNESIELEMNLEYINRSIELISKENESFRFEHEKWLSKCSDEAIKIEKIKNSDSWEIKEKLEKEEREQNEIFELEKRKLEICLKERKERIFETMIYFHKFVKAFYTLIIHAQTEKFNEEIQDQNRISLIFFEDMKRKEKDETIQHHELIFSKNSKKETRKSMKKTSKKVEENEKITKEVEDKEKAVFTQRVFPLQFDEKISLNEKQSENILIDLEDDLKDTKENEQKKKQNRKSKASMTEGNQVVFDQDIRENQSPTRPSRKSGLQDPKSDKIENFCNPPKLNQNRNYSNRNKKTSSYNKDLANSCFN